MRELFINEDHHKWICPDVNNITVNNDVFTYSTTASQSFGMVVNNCTTAKEIDDTHNLLTYTDAECDVSR